MNRILRILNICERFGDYGRLAFIDPAAGRSAAAVSLEASVRPGIGWES